MKMRKTRCSRGYATIPGRWNIEVFYTVSHFGYYVRLVTCIECGEIFAIDLDNPEFKGKTIQEIAGGADCPKCGSLLRETVHPYPETFRIDDGQLGHFDPSHEPSRDSESLVKEFLEIR